MKSLCMFGALVVTACSATPSREDQVGRTSPTPGASTVPVTLGKALSDTTQPLDEPLGSVRAASDAPAAAGAPPTRDASSRTRQCLLTVDGVVRVDGPCAVFPMGEDQYTVNAWTGGKPRNSHFAVVAVDGDGVATATWNADPDDDRALDPLGAVRREGGCWTNERTRLCVR